LKNDGRPTRSILKISKVRVTTDDERNASSCQISLQLLESMRRNGDFYRATLC